MSNLRLPAGQAGSKKIIVIAGPTAVGKTKLAIHIAQKLNTEIISFDSRQCYKEMKIGVARPSEEELSLVSHHFIASHSIHDKIDASFYETYALQLTETLFEKHDTLVMVGGTGLYIKAFLQGLDSIPTISNSIREQIKSDYESKGLEWLQETVKEEDPIFYASGETKNPHRLIRALEVIRGTGKSIRSYQEGSKKEREFETINLFLNLSREELINRINLRTEAMIHDGLVEEVRSLSHFHNLQALQTVGYKEIFEHLEGRCSLDASVENIKINTRQYAKRQVTWFKKGEGYFELPPDEAQAWRIIQANS